MEADALHDLTAAYAEEVWGRLRNTRGPTESPSSEGTMLDAASGIWPKPSA